MVRCWKRSETTGLEDSQRMDEGPTVSCQFPHKAFWVTLSATLLLVIIALGVRGHLWVRQPDAQVVRITVPDLTGTLINQSALVDKHNDLVTYSVTSPANHTTTVLFDIKHGLICYKPMNQETCYLSKMERSDYENMQSLLQQSMQKEVLLGNETQRQTEFLGVMGGSQVDVSTLEEPLQALCRHSSIHWTRRQDGPGKHRLVYFCIDICFPSNICVSVCFYYLPE
ncbi:BRICHOS domain-containing protein 5 isoform X1 [Salmo salar]|uniref:BRICHOS domain-containing protein 5 isoform X1 n=1 Tax=Salmo salar TaxID=8030 RepID=A0A1S3Q5A2_SALSA|nr:BRICHOS domain-containing protein 5 isoform X1 [Salmo salar]|eukprot:XP_014035168.1 PREDICTED: BRICHOS domain-containing protein 5-like isoform X1 [Salmo salar]